MFAQAWRSSAAATGTGTTAAATTVFFAVRKRETCLEVVDTRRSTAVFARGERFAAIRVGRLRVILASTPCFATLIAVRLGSVFALETRIVATFGWRLAGVFTMAVESSGRWGVGGFGCFGAFRVLALWFF